MKVFNPEPGKIADVEVKLIKQPGDLFYSLNSVVYRGMIEKPMKWLSSEQFQMSADSNYPGFESRVIDKISILSIRYLDESEPEEVEFEVRTDFVQIVPGSKGQTYQVRFESGNWSCSCPGFQFRKNCKHVHLMKG